MNAPVVRMGLIPMGPDPLHAYTGHPISYGGAGTGRQYGGVRWAYKKSRRAECKGYDDAVHRYNKAERDLKKAGCNKFAIFPHKDCKKYRNRMNAAETDGKAAWKTCDAHKTAAEKGLVQIDTSGGFSNTSSTGAGAIDPFTGLPVDGGMSTVSYEEDDGGSNMGLYIGIIALLGATGGLIWYKKKKAKSKGSKR